MTAKMKIGLGLVLRAGEGNGAFVREWGINKIMGRL